MKNSISFRFIVIVFLLTSLLFTVLALVLILIANNAQNDQSSAFIQVLEKEKVTKEILLQQTLQRKGESIMRLLAQNGSFLIIGYDFDTLETLAQSGALDAEIMSVTFYDTENKPLTTESSAKPGITLKQPIMFENEPVGQIVVGIDDSFVKASINDSTKSLEKIMADTAKAKDKEMLFMIILVSVFSIAGLMLLCVAIFVSLLRLVIKPINNVISLAERISEGDLAIEDSSSKADITKKDEITRLFIAMDTMVVALKKKVYLAEQIAKGDLSVEITLASERDTLGKALQNMTSKLSNVFSQIGRITADVSSGSTEMSSSSQVISRGATEQASSLEEITSSSTDIGNQARINAENASKANDLVVKTLDSTKKGDDQMKEMVSAIGEINESSQQIAKIIKAIDEIAFQTNLLALNAAVEAARAGKYGKGFAVVAEEVRNLAVRSAEAAKNTTSLIESAAPKVENGISIANQTAEVLMEIFENVEKVTNLVNEISEASQEQSKVISEINSGLEQVGNVTQQNAANTEETASAAEELSVQAADMKEMIKQFTLQQIDNNEKIEQSSAPVVEEFKPTPKIETEQKQTVAKLITLDDSEFGKYS